jgi:hypothetical protein
MTYYGVPGNRAHPDAEAERAHAAVRATRIRSAAPTFDLETLRVIRASLAHNLHAVRPWALMPDPEDQREAPLILARLERAQQAVEDALREVAS